MKKTVLRILGFILSPFAPLIQRRLLKTMKALGNTDDGRPAIAISRHMLEHIVFPSVFKTFSLDEFRHLAHFEKLPVAEHDRIFNELQVAGVLVAEYALGEAKQLVRDGDFHFWSKVEEQYFRQFQKLFMDMGLDSANAKMMRELVQMRKQEYEDFSDAVWAAGNLFAPDVKADIEKNYGPVAVDVKRLFSALHGIAFGTVHHIRRGDISERDPLIRYVMAWLMQLYNTTARFVTKL